MKAISLWQPHAQAIALDLKRYETRDWQTHYRGPLAIHAAKRKWEDAGEWHERAARKLNIAMRGRRLTGGAYGAVVCVVDLVECVPTSALRGAIGEYEFWGDFSDGENGDGRFGWRLENVRPIEPHYVRGQQGLWEVDVPGFEGATAAQGNLNLFGGE